MQTSSSILLVIKTPKIKYADNGFLRKTNDILNVELFNAGIPILDLIINKNICINKICYSKTQFNIQFLKNAYYPDLLRDIILKQYIFNGKNVTTSKNNFTQIIKSKNYDINYSVNGNIGIFRDTKQGILIKIQNIN